MAQRVQHDSSVTLDPATSPGAGPVEVTQPLPTASHEPRAAPGAMEQTTRISKEELLAARTRAEAIRGARGSIPSSGASGTRTAVPKTERLVTVLDRQSNDPGAPGRLGTHDPSHGTTPMSWEQIDALHRGTGDDPPSPRTRHGAMDTRTDRVTIPNLAALAKQASRSPRQG